MTVEGILELAYGRLPRVSPGNIATESVELVHLTNQSLAGLFQVAARANPAFFGVEAVVPFSAPGWPRPTDAESIYRLELTTGAEVIVVPFDDRTIEVSTPAVYEMGQFFRSAGNLLDPTEADSLRMFYSDRPTDAALITDPVDSRWPEAFNILLALEVAIYLALKEGLNDDVARLINDRNIWLTRYLAFLEHATANVTRRRSVAKWRGSVAPAALLAGGQAS